MSVDVGAVLADLWREVLDVAEVGPDDDFYSLGGDSLLAVRLSGQAHLAGLDVDPLDVLSGITLAELIPLAVPIADTQTGTVTTVLEAGPEPSGPLDLLPAQHRWLRDGRIPDIDHFVLHMLFDVPAELPREAVATAVRGLLAQHDALRSRFVSPDTASGPGTQGGDWARAATDGQAAYLTDVDPESAVVSVAMPADSDEETIAATLSAHLRGLSLVDGAVFRVVHLNLGARPGRLLLLAHHLILDGWSTSLLAQDFDACLTAAVRGHRIELSTRSASIRQVARAMADWAVSDEAAKDATEWLALPWRELRPLPRERTGEALLPSLSTAHAWLSIEDTALLLHELPHGGPRPVRLLLASLVVAVAEWSELSTHAIDVYTLGRDAAVGGLDVSRTVGYLQATFPVLMTVPEGASGADAIVDLALSAPAGPARPWGFDALRFLTGPDASSPVVAAADYRTLLRGLPASELRLNYRSQFNRLGRRPEESVLADPTGRVGPHRSPRQRERYRLMFEGDVIEDRLQIGVRYSRDHYTDGTAARLVERTADGLVLAVRRIVGG